MVETTSILIVDDEEVVRQSYCRSLAGAHWHVEMAPSGEDALQRMQTRRFDLVLLDLRMPGLDGLTVLRRIKEQWPESEVVVITGYPAVDSAKTAVSLGAYDYLSKPAGPDQIVNAACGAILHKKWMLRSVAVQDQPLLH